MTNKQKLTVAYNEFIAEFCERHGECKATRDEAHEQADKLVQFGKSIGSSALSMDLSTFDVEGMIESVDWDHADCTRIALLAAWTAYHG